MSWRRIAPWRLAPLRTLSDPEGHFSLPFFPQARLRIGAPGFAPASWQLESLTAAPGSYALAAAPETPAPGVAVESGDEFRRLRKPATGLVEFFRSSPLAESGLELERDEGEGREVEL